MEELRNEIISRIRSCLISIKGQVTLRQLEDDYRTLLGERIPYQKLGHKSLESFIQSIPTIITSRGPNGETFLDAQVSEKSAHISSMVRKQKAAAPKKRVRIAAYPPKYGRAAAYPSSTIPKWRPKKNFNGSSSTYNKRPYTGNSSRLAAVSHNQFVSSPGYRKPLVPSKIVVPDRNDRREMRRAATPPPPPTRDLKRYNSMPENGSSSGFVDESKDDFSPLSSTMKRITRIMSEISVERDSGNSSPTTDFAGNYKLAEFSKTGDPIIDIRNFAAHHKLGDVEVKFTQTKQKKSKVVQCHCKITVGQHKYSSYPEEFFDEPSSERHASQKALDDLMQKYSRRRSLLLSSNDDIIERIPPMLEKHNNAVWMWQIEADYIDKYNEQLPSDWLQIIDNSPQVSIEKYPGGYVLKHCNPDNVLQKGKKMEVNLNLADVSVPCNTVSFGETNRIFAVVTAAHSATEVWCQHCGTKDYENFYEMSARMDFHYTTNKDSLSPKNINFGSCYVILHDGNWLRVRALSMPQEGFVDCFLIDFGEEVHVPIDNVFSLKREFALEQAQAFVCRLDGLEDLQDVSVDSEHLSALHGQEFILEIVTDEMGDNKDVTIPVVLYDMSSGSSINEELITLLAIDSAKPALDKNAITEVYVSNIESNGDIYVQIRTFGYFSFVEMLNCLTESIKRDPQINHLTIPRKGSNGDKLYLVKCRITQQWQRAVIIDWAPKGDLAQIYFIDQGNAQVINVVHEQMYDLENLDASVSQYPPQAIKVRIMIDKIPADFVERAEKLLPKDQPFLLKIISYDNENVAWVEFFKRTSDGVLVFINKSISVEPELLNFDANPSNNNEMTRKRLINLVQFGDGAKTVPSGGSLKKPDLPKMGDYFNVNIPFSVNPWNFFVQPLDTFKQLTTLMADLQEYYKDIQYSPMQIDDIIPGKIYASKHEDGLWYRTSVLKVIHSGSISVFYCDFGYYTNLTLTQLVPLDAKYMILPYQALKAKIAGIKPMKNKWTMDDCEFFNQLVGKKQFVSILVNVDKDELYKSDLVLELLLIDTSSDEDVHIKEILIEKGIATNN